MSQHGGKGNGSLKFFSRGKKKTYIVEITPPQRWNDICFCILFRLHTSHHTHHHHHQHDEYLPQSTLH